MTDDCKPAPNVFTGMLMDRAAHLRKDERWVKKSLSSETARFIPVGKAGLLLTKEEPRAAALLDHDQAGEFVEDKDCIFLGRYRGVDWFTFPFQPEQSPRLEQLGELHTLRSAGTLLDQEDAALLAYAQAMILWHKRHRFCGRCGKPTRSAEAGHVRICSRTTCGKSVFPRVDPAIIVLVYGAGECLLGRQPVWPEGVYSTVAGFVEPGESLEGAVAREVLEETGIRIDDVRYQSSQPWPFPSSLMLGFHARAASREITLNDRELEDARWFSRSDISEGKIKLPSTLSIAYRLVESWYDADADERLAEVVKRHPPWR